MRYFLLFILFPVVAFGEFSKEAESRVLFLVHKGEITTGLTVYLNEAKKGEHNYKLLQESGLALLQEGIKSEEEDIQLLSVVGAGVALHKLSLPILRDAIRSPNPKMQAAALHFLDRFEEDEAILLIKEALSSPFLIVRLEAALILAEKNESVVIEHLQSFYGKMPDVAKAIVPEILVKLDHPSSTKFLKQMLSDPNTQIRVATLYFAALNKRDDLLEMIRKMANHPGYPVEEAAAFALGKFHDYESKPLLKDLCQRNDKDVALAAVKALYDLGETEALATVLEQAKEKNLYAVALLADISDPKSISLLNVLKNDPQFDVALNANLALLNQKDESAFPFFKKLFAESDKDIGFYTVHSPGKALSYWKPIASYSQHLKKIPELESLTLQFKQKVLSKILELPEDNFIELCRVIFEKEQKGKIIPLLAEFLSNHTSEKTTAFLKERLDQAGAPQVRALAALALYNLNQEKLYKDRLLQFIKQEKGKEFAINLSEETVPEKSSPHSLTSQEASQLVLNALETLGNSGDRETLETLLEVMAYGNPKNRYALAGLLIRMTE